MISKEHSDALADAIAHAWARCDAVIEGSAGINEALTACSRAWAIAQEQVIVVDRAYPGRNAPEKLKQERLQRLGAYRDQRAAAVAILTPVLERARAYSRGPEAGRAYDRQRDARVAAETPKLARMAADIEAREARIGGPLDRAVRENIRRAYLGR